MSRVIEFKKIKIRKINQEKEENGYFISDGYENQLFFDEDAENITKEKALEIIEKEFTSWFYEEILGFGFKFDDEYFEIDDLGNILNK